MKEKIKSCIDNFEAYWVKFEQYLIAILAGCISYIYAKYNFGIGLEKNLVLITIFFYFLISIFIFSMILTYHFNKSLLEKLHKINEIEPLKQEVSDLQEAVAYFKEHQIDHAYNQVNSKFLAFIAQKVNLDYTQRVSLYLVDKKRELFHIVGRYSRNGNYDKRHRKTFNLNTGTLGHIWRCATKEKICLSLEDRDYYKECKEKFGILQKDIQKLAMQSREFYAIPIEKDLSSQIGIILFEAEKCDTLSELEIDACINEFKPMLVQLLSQYEELSEITGGK